jgi:phosphatidylinositol glycan class K
MIYVTGHRGDQFFKFQDEEELMADDIAAVLEQMHIQEELMADDIAAVLEKMHIRQAYRQVLFIADTCQAFTLADKISAPNVYALGTSLRGELAAEHHGFVR